VAVVVAGEDAKHALEVTLVYDQEPVETFGADGAHEPLGVSVWGALTRLAARMS
jgi:hypothetical protein